MRRTLQMLVCLIAASALVAMWVSCGGEAPEPQTAVETKPKGPDYQVYAPLPSALIEAQMPMLVGPEAEDLTCFKPVAELAPEDADVLIKDQVEQHGKALTRTMAAWFIEDLGPAGLTETQALGWEIEVEDPVVLEVPREQLRFADGQDCIQDATGWLPEGTRPVTMLIGARTFHFTAKLPLDLDLQEELLQAVGMENMSIESEALFAYDAAVDGEGNPMMGPDGGVLYNSPSGEYIKESEIPAPETRKMKEWTLRSENPVYFAFRELSDDAWRKESAKDNCDVFLIWDDMTPRPPECPEFTESAFSATKTDDGEVALTITTGEQNTGEVLEFGKVGVVNVNDRIILWISPKTIEEGTLLRVNSLVLDPQPMPEGSGGEAEEDYVPVSEPEEEEEEEEKPKKKKKKGKQTDQDSIDAYLND